MAAGCLTDPEIIPAPAMPRLPRGGTAGLPVTIASLRFLLRLMILMRCVPP